LDFFFDLKKKIKSMNRRVLHGSKRNRVKHNVSKKIFFFVNKRMDTAQLMMERATSSHFETTEKQHECDWHDDHE